MTPKWPQTRRPAGICGPPLKKSIENSKSTYKIRGIFKKLLIISIDWMGKTLGQRGPGHAPRRTPRNGPKGPHEGKSEESASHHVSPQPTLHPRWLMVTTWARAGLTDFGSLEVIFGHLMMNFLFFTNAENTIPACVKNCLGSMGNHWGWFWHVLGWVFMNSLENDPKMTPNSPTSRYLRSTPEKIYWKFEIYI